MTGKLRIAVFGLLAIVCAWATAPNGFSGSSPEGRFHAEGNRHVSAGERPVDHRDRGHRAGKREMIELCHRLEDSLARERALRDNEVDVYKETTEPEGTEYRREVRETSRFAAPEDERRTLELCSQLEDPDAPTEPTMAALCRQLQRTTDQTSVHTRSELEEYKAEGTSGEEYTRQYRESSRYSQTARDRDAMLILCAELGYPLR